MTGVVCLYMGRADECVECGFYNATGTRFCSHECADSYDQRGRDMDARAQARRDEEDEFGREVDPRPYPDRPRRRTGGLHPHPGVGLPAPPSGRGWGYRHHRPDGSSADFWCTGTAQASYFALLPQSDGSRRELIARHVITGATEVANG